MTSLENDSVGHLCTCPVCFDVYKNPQSLTCLHVLCIKCVKKLTKYNLVECPECRHISPVIHIKHDFNKQQLVDLYFKEQKRSRNKTIKIPPSNLLAVTPPRFSYLLPAETLIVASRNSKLVTSSSNKTIVAKPINVITRKRIKENIYPSARCLVSVTPPIHSFMLYTANHHSISECKHRSEEEVECKTNPEFLKGSSLDVNYNSEAKNNDCDNNNAEIYPFKKRITNENLKSEELLKRIRTPTHSIKGNCEAGTTDKDHMHKECHKRAKSEEIYSTAKELNDVNNSETEQLRYMKMVVESNFKVVEMIELKYFPRRLHLTDDTLWCTGDNGLYMYDIQRCKLVNTVEHCDLEDVSVIIKDHNCNLIAACWNNNGLHQLDPVGRYMYKIIDGDFSDMIIHQSCLYALDIKKKEIMIFKFKKEKGWFIRPKKWILINYIEVDYKNACNLDTLNVLGDELGDELVIYLCSWKNQCIYKIHSSGQIMNHYGVRGSGAPGKLLSPRLCRNNSFHPSIQVIADRNNHCIHMCSGSGKWITLELPGLKWPRDVFIDKTGHIVWVFAGDGYCKQVIIYSNIEEPMCITEEKPINLVL